MSEELISVESVSKKFSKDLKRSLWYGLLDIGRELTGRRHGGNGDLRKGEFWAVDKVSFTLRRGECLGLIGRNGAGKTTLLRMLNGLVKPDAGRIQIKGRIGALIALGAGFNPVLTGRENIKVNAAVLGLTKREIEDNTDEIIDFAELRDSIDSPVQTYSSGMTVRLGFSIAATLRPDVLILDEVLAVGDARFKSKCFRRIGELLENAAVIIVSHEAYAISRLCDRALYLERGKVICDAEANSALSTYANADSSKPQGEMLNLCEQIISASFSSAQSLIAPGDFIEFTMDVESKADLIIGHVVININDVNDETHAQVLPQMDDRLLARGTTKWQFRIGPLHLSRGYFSLMILVSAQNGKLPLIHSRQQIGFDFESHVCYGPKYYPAGSVRRKQDNENRVINDISL